MASKPLIQDFRLWVHNGEKGSQAASPSVVPAELRGGSGRLPAAETPLSAVSLSLQLTEDSGGQKWASSWAGGWRSPGLGSGNQSSRLVPADYLCDRGRWLCLSGPRARGAGLPLQGSRRQRIGVPRSGAALSARHAPQPFAHGPLLSSSRAILGSKETKELPVGTVSLGILESQVTRATRA